MPNIDPEPLRAWHEVEDIRLTLRGIESRESKVQPSVTFVAKSVLATADRLHSPDAFEFNVDIHIPDDGAIQSIRYQRRLGFWGSLAKVRSDLVALQQSNVHKVQVSLTGLTLRLFSFCNDIHPMGAVCVYGILSNIIEDVDSRWTKRPDKIIGWISSRRTHAYSLRFAFLVPFVDPPFGNDLIDGIDKLVIHLNNRSKK